MKTYFGIALAASIFFGTVSCSEQKKASEENVATEMTVTGVISALENGKDGYMATVSDESGDSYIVTISAINLQQSGTEFRRFEIDDKIEVTGTFWKDDAGKTYITATGVKQVP